MIEIGSALPPAGLGTSRVGSLSVSISEVGVLRDCRGLSDAIGVFELLAGVGEDRSMNKS